jgi:hypothetical protein
MSFLAADPRVMETLSVEGISVQNLPSAWFTASGVKLTDGDGAAFVVRGEGPLLGANIGPFLGTSIS